MKFLLLLVATASLCAGSAIPPVPRDNSHYVEGESRYVWIPDGNDELQLVDLEEPVDENVNPLRDGARNTYLLFTRRNRNNAQTITNGNVNSIRNSNYNGNAPMIVVVHGWNSDRNSGMVAPIRDAYLDMEDGNVIVVDWSPDAGLIYTGAARAVVGVGQHVATFLQWLIYNGGGNWNRVHLIGHSLGAHVNGNAGRWFGGRVNRITGLDPAGPQMGGNSNALNRNDGQYVENIHTNGGTLGIFDPIGDTDFYPNGGEDQPGCTLSSCSHRRSQQLMASSIRYPNRFVGRRCANLQEARRVQCSGATLVMGNIDWNKRGSGLYGLTTGREWPF